MLKFSFLWLPALSQLTFKEFAADLLSECLEVPALSGLISPGTWWKLLARLRTPKFLSWSVLAGFAMWASLQDGLCQLGSWHSLGSAAALGALSPCLAAVPGSKGFVSAFPFLRAGLALQSGRQEQEQDLVYRCKGWEEASPSPGLNNFWRNKYSKCHSEAV